MVDPYEQTLIKLPPPPLPSAWGRVIKAYCPAQGACPDARVSGNSTSLTTLFGVRCTALARAMDEVKDSVQIQTPTIFGFDLKKARKPQQTP